MSSISARITAGFYALAFLLLTLAAFTLSDLRFLAAHILQGTAVSSFVERIMEMRRQEKNYFLYQQPTDLANALQQAASAQQLLDENQPLFTTLCGVEGYHRLYQEVSHYHQLLRHLSLRPTTEAHLDEEQIRVAGHQLTEQSQHLSDLERSTLSEAVEQSRGWLLVTVLGVGLVGGLLGSMIARSVVRPLRQLEIDLAPIAAGRFRELPAPSQDQEMVSLATAFNRMLTELENRRRQLLHSEKLASLGILVSGVAHELNNPLSNISTACQLALEELAAGDPAPLKSWLQQIDTQTQRAHQIVWALSDYARRRPLTLEPIEITQLMETTLLLVRKELGQQVTLKRQLPAGLTIQADRQRMQQVLINLLKNAVDAGGAEVTITLTAQPIEQFEATSLHYCLGELHPTQKRRYIQITVADNGSGITPEALPHIFDPFFTTREVGQGMGLGLYIVQEIVRELEGCIGVVSELGVGTCFNLVLPCAHQEAI